MYFSQIPLAPADPIFLLADQSAKDQRAYKIDLSMGLYYDEFGKIDALNIVKKITLDYQKLPINHLYLGIAGHSKLISLIPNISIGEEYQKKYATASIQSIGGTGGLRVTADYLKAHHPDATVWLSTPTWVNHWGIYHSAGLKTAYYPYYDAAHQSLAFDQLIDHLTINAQEGDVILLHACCHNPTGVDFNLAQWDRLGELIAQKSMLPIFDMAYQGFGEGLLEDLFGIHQVIDHTHTALICNSFSKNMGLYGERVGGITVVSPTQEATQHVISQLKACMRTNYSNPPRHGAQLASMILDNPHHYQAWQTELNQMRLRVEKARIDLKTELDRQGIVLSKMGNDFLSTQKGMFSLLNFSPEQLNRLKDEFAIYLVDGGRINLAGLQNKHIEPLCQAFKAIL